MRKIVRFFTEPYRNKSHYIRSKAEYAAVFMILILCVMALILSTELLSFGFSRHKVASTLGFVLGFVLLFFLLRKGRLELCLNLLILAGYLRCLMIMGYYLSIQFYSTLFLIILTVGVVHIRRYQLYFSYSLAWLLFLIKMLFYRTAPSYPSVSETPLHQAFYSLILITIFMAMVQVIVRVVEREIRERAKLIRLSETDALTGAGNRRKFHNTLSCLKKDSLSKGYCLLLMDLDHFKKINDAYGHDRGDLVLQQMVPLITAEIREEDSLYRWGGEEFLLLTPSLPPEDLRPLAERIRTTVENHTFPEGLSVTISIGGAIGKESTELGELIKQADTALYRAKQSGRNKVCL